MIVMIRRDTGPARRDALRETLEAGGATTFVFRPPEGDVHVAVTGQNRETPAAVREWPEVRRVVTSPRHTLASRSATGKRTRVRLGGRPGVAVGDPELASLMRGVRVDPETRRARVQGGATWADVDRESQAFGLPVPGGIVSTTGVAGLTLGGA